MRIVGLSSGTASVCITGGSVTSSSVLDCWSGSAWVATTSQTIIGSTICGNVPVSALTETNFAISTPSGGTGGGIGGTSGVTTILQAPNATSLASSVTFNLNKANYSKLGSYSGVWVYVSNQWNTAQTTVVFVTLRSGSSLYLAEGTVTLNALHRDWVFAVAL